MSGDVDCDADFDVRSGSRQVFRVGVDSVSAVLHSWPTIVTLRCWTAQRVKEWKKGMKAKVRVTNVRVECTT